MPSGCSPQSWSETQGRPGHPHWQTKVENVEARGSSLGRETVVKSVMVDWLEERVFPGVAFEGSLAVSVSEEDVLGAVVGGLDGEASAIVESRVVSVDGPFVLYSHLASA